MNNKTLSDELLRWAVAKGLDNRLLLEAARRLELCQCVFTSLDEMNHFREPYLRPKEDRRLEGDDDSLPPHPIKKGID